MRKLTFLLMLVLTFAAGLSMKAQESPTGWYAPGERLDVTAIEPGTDVFIYSMCYVNGNASSNYSRFIGNNGNSATTFVGTPTSLVTNKLGYMWRVRSVETVTRTENVTDSGGNVTGTVTYTGTQLTFSRNKGSETTTYYWGIGGVTSNTGDPGNPQKFVLTKWKTQDPYVSGTSKSGTDVYLEDVNGNIIPQSSLTDDDRVYLMCALSGKAINTNNGSYQTNNTNGYPVALYSVTEAPVPADPLGFHVSAAPTTADGVTVWNDDTKWYKLKMNSSSWRYVETGGSYTAASGKLILTNTASSNLFTGAWAVVGNNDSGYQFYNMGEGPSKVLGVTGSEGGARTSMVDATNPGDGVITTFDITYHTDGKWYIKKHGTANDYINNRDYYVALWNSSNALGNSGSCFAFEAIDDVSAYATAAHTTLRGRVGMWKKVPAIWANATAAYDALNVTLSATVTNAELVSAAAAQKTAGAAFVAAVNNPRVTLSNCSTSPAVRVNSFMYFDSSSNTLKGRDATAQNTNNTLDEVFTLKACDDITLKIYNATANKYIGTPGGNNTSFVNEVAERGAAGFDIHTADGFANNSVVFCVNGTATMHLLGGLNVTSWSSKTDQGSRWLLSTDLSRHELNTAIANATAWKNNLETLVSRLVTAKKISVKPISLGVTLPVAITKAQSALNDAAGTQATRTAAITALNEALAKAQGAWLGELGTAQQFRLKNHAITTETTVDEVTTTTHYYLTMGQTKDGSNEGNAILAAYDENDVNQIFTLEPGTGNNAGKYILVSNGKQLTDLGDWNTDMTDAGTPYTFVDVDLANSLFRVRTTKGLLGPNDGVTGASASKFIYTNHTGTRNNLTWELEFIAPTLSETLDRTSLQATFNAQNWVATNSLNFVSQTMPSLTAYTAIRAHADQVIKGTTGTTLTQIDVNTAEAELKAAYQQLLANFVSEAGPTQGYFLQYYHPTNYTAKDLYLTFNTGEFTETHAVNALQLKARSAATQQNAQFVSTGSNNSFYIREGFQKKLVGESTTYNWNPMLKDNGVAYTIELVNIDGIDGLVARLHNIRGYLGCDLKEGEHTAVAAGDYLYTNNSAENYFILTPCVSPDLVITLYNKVAEAQRYEEYIGEGLGKYTTAGGHDKDGLVALNNTTLEFINETGSYEGQAKTNAGVTFQISFYDAQVFPITINKPTAGKLYRFKGKVSGKYMCATSTGQMSMVDDKDLPGTIFLLSEGAEIDRETGYKFLSYNTGYYNNETRGNGALAAAANSFRIYESEGNNLTYYTLKSNYSGSKYVYDNGNQSTPVVDRNGSYAANNCDWTIEEVTWLPVPISQTAKFGTFYSPVPLAISDAYYAEGARIIFYTGAINKESGNLDLTRVTTNIPANTPVVTQYVAHEEYKNGCAYLKIAESADALAGPNDLVGTLETINKPTDQGSIYTLQRPAGKPTGFYLHGGNTVKGCRAYLPIAPGAPAPAGISFNFGTATGIDEVNVENRNDVIYDLSGRRVQKATNGLYIINGKKVLVK